MRYLNVDFSYLGYPRGGRAVHAGLFNGYRTCKGFAPNRLQGHRSATALCVVLANYIGSNTTTGSFLGYVSGRKGLSS